MHADLLRVDCKVTSSSHNIDHSGRHTERASQPCLHIQQTDKERKTKTFLIFLCLFRTLFPLAYTSSFHLSNHPPTLSTWTINSPSMLWGCVLWTGGNESTEGEREKETECAVCVCAHKWGGTDRSSPRVVQGCVCAARPADERQHPTHTPPPPTATTTPTWMGAWYVYSRLGSLNIQAGINNSQKHCEGCRQRKQRESTECTDRCRKD